MAQRDISTGKGEGNESNSLVVQMFSCVRRDHKLAHVASGGDPSSGLKERRSGQKLVHVSMADIERSEHREKHLAFGVIQKRQPARNKSLLS